MKSIKNYVFLFVITCFTTFGCSAAEFHDRAEHKKDLVDGQAIVYQIITAQQLSRGFGASGVSTSIDALASARTTRCFSKSFLGEVLKEHQGIRSISPFTSVKVTLPISCSCGKCPSSLDMKSSDYDVAHYALWHKKIS